MNPDGTGQTRLACIPAYDVHPSWSPDGSKIAFQSDRDGRDQIYVMNADGTGQTSLSDNTAFDEEPAYSSGWHKDCLCFHAGPQYQHIHNVC